MSNSYPAGVGTLGGEIGVSEGFLTTLGGLLYLH